MTNNKEIWWDNWANCSITMKENNAIIESMNRIDYKCPVHGPIKNSEIYSIMVRNNSVSFCWQCGVEFLANNLPKLERI